RHAPLRHGHLPHQGRQARGCRHPSPVAYPGPRPRPALNRAHSAPARPGAVSVPLEGRVTTHHSCLRTEHVSTLEYVDEAIARIRVEIDQQLTAEQEAITLLETTPGGGPRAAEMLIAEIGTARSRFPSAKHLASWAGMCPGNHESGGKRLSGKTR